MGLFIFLTIVWAIICFSTGVPTWFLIGEIFIAGISFVRWAENS